MAYNNTHIAIVEACKRGERKSQYELYQLYSKAMYNICLRMLKQPQDAEDMLQNVFLEVFTNIKRFRNDATIGAWIKRITINRCINFLKKRRIELVPDTDINLATEEVEFEEEDLNVNKINAAMQHLPEGYRLVFSLYMLEGYDHKEIAEILGISTATSKSQLNRAKKKLKLLIHQITANGRPS